MSDTTVYFVDNATTVYFPASVPGPAGTYTAGTGISIVGDVLTNTLPNVTQTLSIAGQNLTLSGGGGTVVIPSGGGGTGTLQTTTDAGNATDNDIFVNDGAVISIGTEEVSGLFNIEIGDGDRGINLLSNVIRSQNILQFKYPTIGDRNMAFRFLTNSVEENVEQGWGPAHYFSLGMNLGEDGTPEQTDLGSCNLSWESDFKNPGSFNAGEFHLNWNWAPDLNGTAAPAARMISLYMGHDPADGVGLSSAYDYWYWNRTGTRAQATADPYWSILWDDNIWNIFEPITMSFKFNNVPIMQQLNAAGTGGIDLMRINSEDKLALLSDQWRLGSGGGAISIEPALGTTEGLQIGTATTRVQDVTIFPVSSSALAFNYAAGEDVYIGRSGSDFAINNTVISGTDPYRFSLTAPDNTLVVTPSGNVEIGGSGFGKATVQLPTGDNGIGIHIANLNGAGTAGMYFGGSSASPLKWLRSDVSAAAGISANFSNLSSNPAADAFLQVETAGAGGSPYIFYYPGTAAAWVSGVKKSTDQYQIISGVNMSGTVKAEIGLQSASFFGTGALGVHNGTTAERPASPSGPMIRFNSTTTKFEGWTGAAWVDFH